MLLFTQHNTEIEYHAEIGILEIRWIRILPKEQLYTIKEEVLKYLATYNLNYLLFDATLMDDIALVNGKQTSIIFQTVLPATSLEKIAVVVSEAVKDVLSIEHGLAAYARLRNAKYQLRLFQHHYEAMDWLLECTKFKFDQTF